MPSRFDTIITQISNLLVPGTILTELDSDHKDHAVFQGNTMRCYCPIHKDTVVRSLAIDLDRKTFKCSYVPCLGYKGGNLLELFALARNQSLLDAATFWATKLGLEKELTEITGGQLEIPERMAGESEELSYFLVDHKQLTRLISLEMRRAERQKSKVVVVLLEFSGQRLGLAAQEYWAKKTFVTELVNWLPKKLRGIDIVVQYSEETIILILPDTDEKGAIAVLHKIAKQLLQGKTAAGFSLPADRVALSYSLVSYDDKKKRMHQTSTTLLKDALQTTRRPL